ncbi:MAG: xylose isomerase, partial [Phycisphaerales bacterium JB037]
MTTDRREFLAAAGAGLGLGAIGAGVARGSTATGGKSSARGEKFSMHFAPHLGMFRHHAGDDPIAQLEFMADAGFTAFEDNGMGGRDHDLQRRMAQTMERVGLTMGVFVASAHWGEHTFVKPWREVGDRLAGNMRNAVEIAKRVNAKWCTVLLDAINHRVDMAYQTANAIECLKRCAEICEPAGLVM